MPRPIVPQSNRNHNRIPGELWPGEDDALDGKLGALANTLRCLDQGLSNARGGSPDEKFRALVYAGKTIKAVSTMLESNLGEALEAIDEDKKAEL